MNNPEYKDELKERSERGWELVSVQNIAGGCYDYRTSTQWGLGYAITAGLMMFWKRQLD